MHEKKIYYIQGFMVLIFYFDLKKYVLNHENQYVPSIRWYPTKERDLKNYAIENASLRKNSSFKPEYAAEYEKQSLLSNAASAKHGSALPTCKAAALQVLMFRDKTLASLFDRRKAELAQR